jgi:hypothetical protein
VTAIYTCQKSTLLKEICNGKPHTARVVTGVIKSNDAKSITDLKNINYLLLNMC